MRQVAIEPVQVRKEDADKAQREHRVGLVAQVVLLEPQANLKEHKSEDSPRYRKRDVAELEPAQRSDQSRGGPRVDRRNELRKQNVRAKLVADRRIQQQRCDADGKQLQRDVYAKNTVRRVGVHPEIDNDGVNDRSESEQVRLRGEMLRPQPCGDLAQQKCEDEPRHAQPRAVWMQGDGQT